MNKFLSFLLLIAIPSIFWGQESTPSHNAETLGILTLIPPLLAIILAFLTHRVYFSLFIGIWSGTILLMGVDGVSFGDFYHSFEKIITILINVLSDSWSATIIAQLITIGGLIAIISKNGGAYAIANSLAKRAKTARSAQLLTSFIALFMFFDDYANCLITGPVMRPVTDKLKVSREKLAFIVDATAAPIAGVALISTWIGYELGVLRDAYIASGVPDPNTYMIFIKTLPYRFYNFFMLGFVIIIALMNKDFGPMLIAEKKARQNGIVSTSENNIINSFLKPRENIKYYISNALIPILVLIFGAFFGIWYDGYRVLHSADPNFADNLSTYQYILAILSKTDVILVIFKSAVLASIVAMILSAITKTMSFFQAIDAWVLGAKNLLSTILVLLLAWSISVIIKELGTSLYLIKLLQNNISPILIPSITFILACIISFSTGTAYGTMGIMMPLAVPLAASLSGGPESLTTIVAAGSVLTGAIVGDHCSPISDTTILSSGGVECPLINHVETQLPYTILVAGVSIFLGYLLIGLGFSLLLSYSLGFLSLILILFFIGKNPDK